jgi:hypothetical protein
MSGDSAIYLADSPDTQVLHNTIFISGTYGSPIEYRFPHTARVVIANNVLDGNVASRDGATGSVVGNYTSAVAGFFVNPASGDLHLVPTATALINKVSAPPAAAATDWDGQPRPAGATDIGADEYIPAGPPPNTPSNLRIVGWGRPGDTQPGQSIVTVTGDSQESCSPGKIAEINVSWPCVSGRERRGVPILLQTLPTMALFE